MRGLSVLLVAILACSSAKETCWPDNKCIEVFSTRFFQEQTSSEFSNGNAEFAFQYVNGSPAVSVSSDLPRIQLIGDFSGVENDDLVIRLVNFVDDFKVGKSINALDSENGLKISEPYAVRNEK